MRIVLRIGLAAAAALVLGACSAGNAAFLPTAQGGQLAAPLAVSGPSAAHAGVTATANAPSNATSTALQRMTSGPCNKVGCCETADWCTCLVHTGWWCILDKKHSAAIRAVKRRPPPPSSGTSGSQVAKNGGSAWYALTPASSAQQLYVQMNLRNNKPTTPLMLCNYAAGAVGSLSATTTSQKAKPTIPSSAGTLPFCSASTSNAGHTTASSPHPIPIGWSVTKMTVFGEGAFVIWCYNDGATTACSSQFIPI